MFESQDIESFAEGISTSIESLQGNLNSISFSISDATDYTERVSDSIDELRKELRNTNELLRLIANEADIIGTAIYRYVSNSI